MTKKKPATQFVKKMADACTLSKELGETFVDFVDKKWKGERPSPEALVKEAKKKSSPIHDCWPTWDAESAANRHWREHALYLLRNVDLIEVEVSTGEPIAPPVKAWVNIEVGPDRSIPTEYYIPTQNVTKEEDVIFLMKKLRTELRNTLTRYEAYNKFFDYYGPILELVNKITFSDEEEEKPKKKNRKKTVKAKAAKKPQGKQSL